MIVSLLSAQVVPSLPQTPAGMTCEGDAMPVSNVAAHTVLGHFMEAFDHGYDNTSPEGVDDTDSLRTFVGVPNVSFVKYWEYLDFSSKCSRTVS